MLLEHFSHILVQQLSASSWPLKLSDATISLPDGVSSWFSGSYFNLEAKRPRMEI